MKDVIAQRMTRSVAYGYDRSASHAVRRLLHVGPSYRWQEIDGENPHIGQMRTHPYAEATYRVVTLPGGAFGVEVKTPEANPATVSSFDTVAAAEAWIARNKKRVEEQSVPRNTFRRSGPRA
jgi:hypothetical protein